MIVDSLTPEEVCQGLKLCPKKVEDNRCVLCEYVMSTLEEKLKDKATEEEIREGLEKVCESFPESIKNKCEKFVDQYADMIVDFITNEVTPEEVCQQLGLCMTINAGSRAEQWGMLDHVDHIAHEEEQDVEVERPYCTLCEYAIGEVDKLITDKKNEEEIKNVLDRICYELSTPIQKECLKMVNTYMDEIIDMFVSEYTPQEVCAELGLCKEPKNDVQAEFNNVIPMDFEASHDVQNGPYCVICEFAMHILETQLLTNRTLDMAEHAIEMLCSYMPRTVGDKCIDFVQEYGDKVVELIIEMEMNPEQVCSALTLCTSQYTTTVTTYGNIILLSFLNLFCCGKRLQNLSICLCPCVGNSLQLEELVLLIAISIE